MLKKIIATTVIATVILSSHYAIQGINLSGEEIDVVSAATGVVVTPAPVPAPTPTPVPVVTTPVVVTEPKVSTPSQHKWSNVPSAWAVDELKTAQENGLTLQELLTEYDKPITRLEFARLIVNKQAASGRAIVSPNITKPFKDTNSQEVAIAYDLGFINGVGNASFNPDGTLTRQESAVIFYREWQKVYGMNTMPAEKMSFTDTDRIATWAKDAVQFMVGMGLMKGNDRNQIDPLGQTTREQSIVLTLRSFQKESSLVTDAVTSATVDGSGGEEERDDVDEMDEIDEIDD